MEMRSSDAVTIEAIQADLIKKAVSNMKFMTDKDSSFRKLISGSKLYPEIPFTVSARKDQGELYDRLKEIVNVQGEDRIEVTGKIDLALEDGDGTWRILDYKTDHMLPVDNGSTEAFHERLKQQYRYPMDHDEPIRMLSEGELVNIVPLEYGRGHWMIVCDGDNVYYAPSDLFEY